MHILFLVLKATRLSYTVTIRSTFITMVELTPGALWHICNSSYTNCKLGVRLLCSM